MQLYRKGVSYALTALLMTWACAHATEEKNLRAEMQKIMHQPKYAHATWGMYVKDLQTGKVLFDLNGEKFFSPASTTKLFSIAALLYTLGDDFRFKTPVFAEGDIVDGRLEGNLILVAQGDLTLGGRQSNPDKIAFTKLDHIIANQVPGVILTQEDPLNGINALAKQIYQKGIREITGDVVIDDTIFETIHKREMVLSPIMINENLIDIVINPGKQGQNALLTWRPQVPGYAVENQLKTVAKGEALAIEISSDDSGHTIVVSGTIPIDQRDIVRTFSIEAPKAFARAAFIQALQKAGVQVNVAPEKVETAHAISPQKRQLVAQWTSPPLSEYATLILKVSHNLGADLVPLLLAAHRGQKTFEEGMRLLGDFITQEVKLSPQAFVLIDAAGGNENRLTPQGEVVLLEFIHKQAPARFQHFFNALPILGVDGSLEDFAKDSSAVGKVRAKPGTGVAFNLATGKYFLITQALAGYIEGKNGHLLAYMLVVNNGSMPAIDDVFAIFEDESQLSSMIYNHAEDKMESR